MVEDPILELKKIASFMELPEVVIESAVDIYERAVKMSLSVWGDMYIIIAAIFIACRRACLPLTLSEVVHRSGARVDGKRMNRACRAVMKKLGLLPMPRIRPDAFIQRFCSELGLSKEVQRRAIEIARKAREKNLTAGRSPEVIAAAAIYTASILCGEKVTQRRIADVAYVSDVIIRERYREMVEKLGRDIYL